MEEEEGGKREGVEHIAAPHRPSSAPQEGSEHSPTALILQCINHCHCHWHGMYSSTLVLIHTIHTITRMTLETLRLVAKLSLC